MLHSLSLLFGITSPCFRHWVSRKPGIEAGSEQRPAPAGHKRAGILEFPEFNWKAAEKHKLKSKLDWLFWLSNRSSLEPLKRLAACLVALRKTFHGSLPLLRTGSLRICQQQKEAFESCLSCSPAVLQQHTSLKKRPLQKPSSGNHKDKKRMVRKECKRVGAVERAWNYDFIICILEFLFIVFSWEVGDGGPGTYIQ